jgi:hypothetical protein
MNSTNVFLEIGKKKTFAGALDWPGWCRSGVDETTALQALVDYGPRYAQVLQSKEIKYSFPADVSEFMVTERQPGNATTDFGAPSIIVDADREPIDQMEFKRMQTILEACWQAFDNTVQKAARKELQKGPRGGGRNLDKIINHVLDGDRGYLSRLAWKHKRGDEEYLSDELARTRQAILAALQVAANGELPERGPRGGIIWPARFFVRRVAWHVLDHTWEIEDRII